MSVETQDEVVEVAQEYLLAVRSGEDTTGYRERLADLDVQSVAALSDQREAALAFWLDVYNAAAQDALTADPERYESRWRFFRKKVVTVASEPLSLDDVEHGILRGSRSKYGFGYLPRLASSRFQRRVALETVDPRIHFALNCGAASCPAIRAYESAVVDEQLATATATYLDRTVEYDPDDGIVRVPRVCLWFYRDFGRKPGILRLLREHGVVPPEATPRLRFRSFDWSLRPGRFVEAPEEPSR